MKGTGVATLLVGLPKHIEQLLERSDQHIHSPATPPLGCRTPALFGEVYICQPKCQLPSRSKSNLMRPAWHMPHKKQHAYFEATSRLRDVLKM